MFVEGGGCGLRVGVCVEGEGVLRGCLLRGRVSVEGRCVC